MVRPIVRDSRKQEAPDFSNDQEGVTREAAGQLASCYRSLTARGVEPALSRGFILQMMVALFGDRLRLLPEGFVSHLLEECVPPARSAQLLGDLFQSMKTGGVPGGRYQKVPRFNGGLFEEPARVELRAPEMDLLRQVATYDWSKVRPEIFGTLFEQSLEEQPRDERHAYGAYFTSPVDIMKVVGPTLVEPWRREIAAAGSIEKMDRVLERMTAFRVLDPACGSGNFLYIAYRELKRLEWEATQKRQKMFRSEGRKQTSFSLVSARQFYGMDINPFAVELAKVTLGIAHKLVIDELKLHEEPLPFDNLNDNIFVADALVDEHGERTVWPRADVVIGNPPFLGSKRLKPERGAAYVNALRKLYPEVPGLADYCVYWFRRTHEHLPDVTAKNPTSGRAGLVGTQNVRNNQSRVGGLDHITRGGTIVEAVDNQPWSGDASVHVSIVNWLKGPDAARLAGPRRLWSAGPLARREGRTDYELTCREVAGINSALSDGVDVSTRKTLACNQTPKRCFQGKIPGYEGFMLDRETALRLATDSSEVVVPYITGRELLDTFQIDRWAIDFGGRDQMKASAFPSAWAHCREHVLPDVQATLKEAERSDSDMAPARREHLDRWWQFWNRRDELSEALARMSRYIGCSRVTRRPIMVFLSTDICPSDLVQVFAFDDDYSFGVLQSALHFEWFRTSSRLKIESDMRYSVRAVYETFPWPQGPGFGGPEWKQVLAVAEAAREVRAARAEALTQVKGGLRALYRTLEEPGRSRLRDAQSALDAAVLQAYGFAREEPVLAQLLTLNAAVSARIERGQEVTAPGIPPSARGQPERLQSSDCYQGDPPRP